ncbi:MAG: hypothetical protein O6952_02100 [Planctomycetota bacterium]|nr:hypothetical protein [Planctomycetota bacterium]
MSTLAKVFVIMNLVLSVAFLTVAGTLFHHQKDWRAAFNNLAKAHKTRVDHYSDKVKSLQGELTTLDAYINSKEEEIRQKDSSLDKLREDLMSLRASLSVKRQEFQLLLSEHKKVVDQIDSKDARIRDLSSENDVVKTERGVALQDKEVAEFQVARLTQIKNDLEGDLADLRKAHHTVKIKQEDLQGILDQLQEYGVDWRLYVVEGVPPPTIHAKVTAVEAEDGLAILSVGSNDKAEVGHLFTVFRGSQFVARVVVEMVESTWSGARILDQQLPVREGDDASTRPGF